MNDFKINVDGNVVIITKDGSQLASVAVHKSSFDPNHDQLSKLVVDELISNMDKFVNDVVSKIKPPPMTNQEYVAHNGILCPFYKEGRAEDEGKPYRWDNGIVRQKSVCSKCDSTWVEEYSLSGYRYKDKDLLGKEICS